MTMSGELVVSLLHKEGAAALGKLLQEAGVGRLGAEGTPAEELAEGGHTVAAFVCHPQAWYLALWRRGCEGKGALFARLTDESRWARLGRQKAPRAGRAEAREARPGRAAGQAAPANWSAEHARQFWYGEPANPAAFREWLQAVLGHPATRRLVGATGGLLKSSRWSGLMTREYVETFLARSGAGAIAPETVKDLLALDAQKGRPLLFIRSEHQASDTRAALDALGVALPPAQADAEAALGDAGLADLAAWFDDASSALVAKHEKFILRRFGYAGASDGADDAAEGAAKPKRKRAGAAAARRKAKTEAGDGKKAARKRKKAQGRGDSAAAGTAAAADDAAAGERSAERAAERSAGRATRRASKRAAAPSTGGADPADPAAATAAAAGKAKAGKARSSKAKKASSKASSNAEQPADQPDTEDLID